MGLLREYKLLVDTRMDTNWRIENEV